MKSRSNMIDLTAFDIVLTTYALLGMDYADREITDVPQSKRSSSVKPSTTTGKVARKPRLNNNNLVTQRWTRVILDEAHNIKTRNSN